MSVAAKARHTKLTMTFPLGSARENPNASGFFFYLGYSQLNGSRMEVPGMANITAFVDKDGQIKQKFREQIKQHFAAEIGDNYVQFAVTVGGRSPDSAEVHMHHVQQCDAPKKVKGRK